MLRKAERT